MVEGLAGTAEELEAVHFLNTAAFHGACLLRTSVQDKMGVTVKL